MTRSGKKMASKDVRRRKKHCLLCGGGLDYESATLDHVVPRALGGRDDLTNLALAHRPCNRARNTSAVTVLRRNEDGIPLSLAITRDFMYFRSTSVYYRQRGRRVSSVCKSA